MNWLKYKLSASGTRLLIAGGLCLSLFFNASVPAFAQSITDEGTVLAYLIEMYRRTGRDCQEARQPNMPELIVSDQLKQAIHAVEGGKDAQTAISEQGLLSNGSAIFTVSGDTPRQAFSALKDQNCAGLLGNYNQIAASKNSGRWTVLLADVRQAPPATPEPEAMPAPESAAFGAAPAPVAAVSPSAVQPTAPQAVPYSEPATPVAEAPGMEEEKAPRKLPPGFSPTEMEPGIPDASVNWRIKGGQIVSSDSSPRPVTVPPGTNAAPQAVPAPAPSSFSSAATPNPALSAPKGGLELVKESSTPTKTVYRAQDGSLIIVNTEDPDQPQTSTPIPPKAQVPPVALSGEAQMAFELINQARASGRQCGAKNMPAAPRLTLDPALTRAAQKHVQDMAKNNYFAQKSLNGNQADRRISDEGFMWVSIGENIARGHATAQPLVQGWLAAPRNCENIMSGSFDSAGIAFDPASQIWVLDLAKAMQ